MACGVLEPAPLSRSDWYAYPTDFGGVNPKDYHYSPTAMTRDPFTVATVHKGSSNEVMVRNGIDLLGSEAPSRIRCSSKARGEATPAALAARGVTHLGGKPVASVVVW